MGGWLFLVNENGSKLLSCVFWNDVLCPCRKDARDQMMARCFDCAECKRFEDDMDEEDARVMAEIDEEHKRLEERRGASK